MAILSSRGVTPDMEFVCCACGDKFTGADVIEDKIRLHIVRAAREDQTKHIFRCECCQEEWEEERMDY